MDYDVVIGLEVHLQLATRTKLFCGCVTTFGAPPNSQTCPVCLGLPGVLPVLNQQALEWGIRVARAAHCTIASVMRFDRKQYFYPDLPKNYQISQYNHPLATQGYVEITPEGQTKRIVIRRIHLEEDAGKLLHDAHPTDSCVDFNRTGVPLLEIVSEPDLRSSEEAFQYLLELKAILQYLDVSTCNMEEGSLRCDTNISLKPRGTDALGTRVEIKNLNSFRAVRLALDYEAQRQAKAFERGERIVQETRFWDAKRLKTDSMRSKEEAADYRYFPEPDLVPFVIEPALVARVEASCPELPAARRARLQGAYGLSTYDAQVLTQHRVLAELFEGALRAGAQAKPVANWLMGELLAYLNAHGLEPDVLLGTVPPLPGQGGIKLHAEWLAHLLHLIADGTLSGPMAKTIFVQMLERGVDPRQLVQEQGVKQVVDEGALDRIAEEVLQANPQPVHEYLTGKKTVFTHLMGQAMKRSGGTANPTRMAERLRQKLDAAMKT